MWLVLAATVMYFSAVDVKQTFGDSESEDAVIFFGDSNDFSRISFEA